MKARKWTKQQHPESQQWTHQLVVGHVARCWTELCIQFDDLVNGVDEISLCGNLASWADGKHSRLSTHTVYVGTYKQTAKKTINIHCVSEKRDHSFDDKLKLELSIYKDFWHTYY